MEQIGKEKLQQKANGQEDHLTKASTGSKRRKGLLQEWFRDTRTNEKMTREWREAIRDKQMRSGESICKIISEEQILPQEEKRKIERHAHIQVWGEITMFYETAPEK
ncbi:hypothetical protein QL285_075228 [Trifolium repens]|nr:hypothetical protein QL285_075228 [Trifolium repens]